MKLAPNMNGLVRFSHTTNIFVNEYFLPILKFTCTSPGTPMFCLLAIFTVTELLLNFPNKPNAETVSMFMQLISAPESNKHEKTNPAVSNLNVATHAMPLLIVNTWEVSLTQSK